MSYITPIEHFVKSFNRHHRKTSLSKQQIEKAIALINLKLNPICCRENEVVDLITTKQSMFISTIEKLLSITPKSNNVKSLLRTKKILENSIGVDCCKIN